MLDINERDSNPREPVICVDVKPVEGAHARSVLYSVVISVKVNKVNPQKAPTQILTELSIV